MESWISEFPFYWKVPFINYLQTTKSPAFPLREAKEEGVNKLPVTQQRLPSRLPSEWRQVNDLHQPRSQGPFSSPLDEAERALEKRLAWPLYLYYVLVLLFSLC